ncbi:hypothetical protein Aperf_G00000025032 [Anoplocephala perfoliata]
MPPGKKTAVAKSIKIDSKKQVSLMAFVKPTTSAEVNPEPSASAAAKRPNSVPLEYSRTVIPETPEVKKGTSRAFRSSTGDLVQPPPLPLPPASNNYRYGKARRSNFVTQRHALVMEKRALEGRVEPISRQGDYDDLNYAPIHQNPVSSTLNTFASQRARRMVQIAVGKSSQTKPRPVKRPLVLEEDSLAEDSAVVEENLEFPSRGVKVRRTVTLDSPERRHLNDVLAEISDNFERPELKASSNIKIGVSDENIILEDSFVNALDDDWSREFDGHLTAERKDCVKASETKERLWYHCRVIDFSSKGHSVVVMAIRLDTHEPLTINLSGTWTDTPLQIGDTIHLVPSAADHQTSITSHSTFFLADDGDFESDARKNALPIPRLLVLHPEVLISGTTVATAAAGGCSRRAVLQHLWAENEALESLDDPSTSTPGTSKPVVNVMLVGSVVHEVFQEVIKSYMSGNPVSPREVLFNKAVKPPIVLQLLEQEVFSIGFLPSGLRLQQTVSRQDSKLRSVISLNLEISVETPKDREGHTDIYALGDSVEEFCNALEAFLPRLDHWVKEHCSTTSRSVPPVINEVLDIEENIWCTKIGVKGKIDMSVVCRTSNKSNPSLIPLELKTGKPSFSFEHQGQVLLYLLMLSDRYSDRRPDVAREGWLVYLRQPDCHSCQSGLIKPQAASFRGLIQTRNRLAASLKRLIALEDLVLGGGKVDVKWNPRLPSPLDRERICSRCPYLLTCGLFRSENAPPPTDIQLEQMLKDRVRHVSVDHKTFMRHWTRLQLLEYATSNRVDKILARIAESNPTPSCTGIRGLIIQNAINSNDDRMFSICLKKQDGSPIVTQGFSLGDHLIVSSDDGRHVGLCLASLSTISPSSNSLTINTDSIAGDMFIYLASARLRQLIINRTCPRFTSNLRKSTLLVVRRFLRPLNIHQRRAVLSVLMSKDYTLIEGFPGSGKTETLTALLRCLALLGKRTLLISHTHSAVDNVLLRLLKDSDVKFIRLGSPDKVHHLLRSHNLETLLLQETSSVSSRATPEQTTTICSRLVKFIDNVLSQATLVGCTALAASGHEALERRRFDVVVVDEATQLLLPTAIGGLLKLEPDSGQFVLVGDGNQLPPLVQSNVAREGGFGTSLFAHLSSIIQQYQDTQVSEEDDSLGSCLVQLKAQFRMNSRILHLANRLFYNGKMECASVEVATRTLELALTGEESATWLNRVLSPTIDDSLIFLDTQSNCKNLGSTSNSTEVVIVSKIVYEFIQKGISAEDIGVIAPYRAQVDALRQHLLGGTDQTSPLTGVEVSTADQFQGRGKSLIIVSFVDCLRQNGRQDGATASSSKCFLLDSSSGVIPSGDFGLACLKTVILVIGSFLLALAEMDAVA